MILPDVPGYVFRVAKVGDGPSIAELMRVCDAVYGTAEAMSALPSPALMAMLRHLPAARAFVGEQASVIVAAGWLQHVYSDRVVVSCYVEPAHGPDVRAKLMAALEESAPALERTGISKEGYWLRCEHILGAAADRLPHEYIVALEQRGFERFYVEHEMVWVLDGPPVRQTSPKGVEIVQWDADLHDAQMRSTYNEAFLDRGFAGYDEDKWVDADPTQQSEFRPDLSVFARSEGTIAGFCLCEIADEPGVGWIDAVGVRPPYRGRGIASAMISRSLDAMRGAGIERATLRVNDDNDRARRVYERLGFVTVKRHVVYRKAIRAQSQKAKGAG